MPLARCDACQDSCAKDWILWECLPVPAFGNPSGANVKVATISINPSEYEFRDGKGHPHQPEKRLPMLEDFGVMERKALTENDVKAARLRRDAYFTNHPYGFFTHLGDMLNLMNPEWSYESGTAVHLDVVACATKANWSDVKGEAQQKLLQQCSPKFELTLSGFENGTQLVVNGRTAWNALRSLKGLKAKTFSFGPDVFVGHLTTSTKEFPVFGWSPFIPWCKGPEILTVLRRWRERPKAAGG